MAQVDGSGHKAAQDAVKHLQIGIIGMGLMGKIFASDAESFPHRVNACDLPAKLEELRSEFANDPNISILEDGHLVSRISDWIIYNVEAESIGAVVSRYGRSTKAGAIVGGQTSCKAPEIEAFEKHLPSDVDIISIHSLHGPGVDPKGLPLVVIPHKDTRGDSADKVRQIMKCFDSKMVTLSAEEHDRITADTQAVTHAAFLSMGAAWEANKQFPWELSRYLGGIENVKINITLRIYSNKWHVYAGLAILNPAAKAQIKQYSKSVTELFKLMLNGEREELTKRILTARDAVFPKRKRAGSNEETADDVLLNDEVLNQFSLGEVPVERLKNNHLSLLAMVDCWWKLEIVPYDHIICSTPLFRMWLGAAEYLFRNEQLLQESIDTAIDDKTFRADDLEFTFNARDWSQRVSLNAFDAYKEKFETIAAYFAPRFDEANKVGNEMIKTILERT